MIVWSYTLTEYEPARPWLVVSTGRASVELEDEADFHAWARERYPRDRYRVEVDREPFRWVGR